MNWAYLLLAYVSLFGLGLADNTRGPVYPELLAQFSLTNSQGALFFWLASLFGMFNNLLTDRWLNKWGVMGSLRRYLFLLGSACVMIAIADTIEVVWIGIAMMGASFGGLAVAQTLLVVHGSSPVRRTQALSGLHTMYGLASLLAPITVSFSYLLAWKWNQTFFVAATIPFALLLWSFKEKSTPRLNLEHKDEGNSTLGLKPLFWVATFTSLYVNSEILISSRLVQYVRAYEDYSPKQANDLLAGFFITLLAGRLLMTVVRVPVKNSTLLKSSMGLAAITMGLGIFNNPLWFVACGYVMSPTFPCVIAYASEVFGAHTARVMAWIFTGNYVGLIVMHSSVGAITDAIGLKQALVLGPLFLVAGVLLLSRKPALPSTETAHPPRENAGHRL